MPGVEVRRVALGACLVAALASGCSVAIKSNRRTLNELDSMVRIRGTAGKVAAAPLFVPVGTVALALDVAVVHPMAAAPVAAEDTQEVLWTEVALEEFREMLLLPLRLAATPVVFAGDWAGRCLLPLELEGRRR